MLTPVNHLFDGTGFDNESYGLFVLTERDPFFREFYQPTKITGFVIDESNYELTGFDGLLHEMCHAIDLHERKVFSRLLKTNFGFSNNFNGINKLQVMLTELKVLTMQSFIGEALFGKVTDNYNIPETKAAFRRRWADISDEKWHTYTDSCVSKHRDNGIDYYRDQWNRASRYVAKHR